MQRAEAEITKEVQQMEKAKAKYRDISFFSEKNQTMVCVHSRRAREYANVLEQDPEVVSYQAGIPLELEQYQYVAPVDIRKEYFDTEWATDFLLRYSDGSAGVRELVIKDELAKRAAVEKLEFSRRYWTAQIIRDWKLVVIEREGGYVL